MTTRRRCSVCGKSRPAAETTLVSAKIGGDYRRAARRGQRRVCRTCTQERVDFAREQQRQKLNTTVSDGRISWAYAARYFGIDIAGLRERP